MLLTSLKLTSFRSYPKKDFSLLPLVNLVVGPNTSGKSNLLESIFLLATGKSERAGLDQEMISYSREFAKVTGIVERNSDKEKLEVLLTRGLVNGKTMAKKRYFVNDVPRRMVDFVGKLTCVLFTPEDLNIIIGSPSIRRHYLNQVLEMVDREYRRASLSYEKGIKQRNRLLEQIRDEGKSRTILYFWDRLLLENGAILTRKRQEFIEFLNQEPDLFGELAIAYQPSIISPERLEKYQHEEVAAGMTLVGPHRDDFLVMSGERNLQIYGSRGEQRTAVFSLKIGELEYFAHKTSTRPVLLLDDIFSELDSINRQKLLRVIAKQQTIVTTTDLSLIEPLNKEEMNVIKLFTE